MKYLFVDGVKMKANANRYSFGWVQSVSKRSAWLEKMLHLNRSIQSEGAFGVLKPNYGFRRFLRRGTVNVLTETLLLYYGLYD